MGRLQQLQVTYAPEEDRILLRVNTTEREEFRFWLTRRLVLRLLAGLTRSLARQPDVGAHPDPEARREVFRFRREQALAKADFKTTYREGAERFPLGEQPVLVTGVRLRRQAEGRWLLVLQPAGGQNTEIVLKEDMVYSLHSLLLKTAEGAGWGKAQAPQAPAGEVPEGVTIN
ncbi:MAG: hypothetical protein U5S82_06685 [Gammaproteobacteria bacterium]|nr:hypothetical protein [Gammaproteobacteria bacterium]